MNIFWNLYSKEYIFGGRNSDLGCFFSWHLKMTLKYILKSKFLFTVMMNLMYWVLIVSKKSFIAVEVQEKCKWYTISFEVVSVEILMLNALSPFQIFVCPF